MVNAIQQVSIKPFSWLWLDLPTRDHGYKIIYSR
jgi:hypothetical protein